MKILPRMGQEIQKVAYRAYPGRGVPMILPLIQLMYQDNLESVKKFIYENNAKLAAYPAIYKYLMNEFSDVPKCEYELK